MDQFVTDCPACSRAAALAIDEIRLLVPLDESQRARVVFSCPTCGRRAAVGVADPVLDALLSTGVPTSYGHPNLGHRRRVTDGPAFTHDDLLDLHLLLQGDDWFARLEALAAR